MKFSRYVFPVAVPGSGDGEIRTLDPLLARQVLSQLSYAPMNEAGGHLLSHAVPSTVSSAVRVLTIVFGMCTGVPRGRIATSCFLLLFPHMGTQTV